MYCIYMCYSGVYMLAVQCNVDDALVTTVRNLYKETC